MLEREIKIFLSGVRYGRERRMAMDAGEHWITVNGGSRKDGEGGGGHVMIDGEGRIVAGMGGKYNGIKPEDPPRKHFINEGSYQKRQAAAAAAGATAASGLYHKGKDGSEFYRYAGSPEGTAWRRKIDAAMNDPKYPAEREDYEAARREADQRAQEAQRKAEQAAASAQQSAQRKAEQAAASAQQSAQQSPADQMTALGLNRWQKNGRDRFYMASPGTATKAEQMAQVLGLEIQRDRHEVTSAKINGIDISNSRLRALNDAIRDDQTYYDNAAGKWVGMPSGLEPKFPTAEARTAPIAAKPAPEPAPAPVRIDTPPGAAAGAGAAASGGTVPFSHFETRAALPLADRQRVDLSPAEAHAAATKIRSEWYSAPLKDGHAYMRLPVRISKESEKAVYTKDLRGASYFDGNEESFRGGVWLPKSHCTIKDGRVIGVSPWIAAEKGIVPLGYYRSGGGVHQLPDQSQRDMDAVLTKRAIDSNDTLVLSNVMQPSRQSADYVRGAVDRWKAEDSGRASGNDQPDAS